MPELGEGRVLLTLGTAAGMPLRASGSRSFRARGVPASVDVPGVVVTAGGERFTGVRGASDVST
jgi:hypothetical protein